MAIASDDIQSARRQAGFHRKLRQSYAGQTSIFGRLKHCGITHRECWCQCATKHLRGIVPGNDVGRHAMRHPNNLHVIAVQVRNLLTMNFVGSAAIKLEIAGNGDDVIARHGHRLACIACFDQRDLFGMFDDQLAKLHQDAATLGGRHASPCTVQCTLGCSYGQINIRRCPTRNRRKGLVIARIDDFNGLPVNGRPPLAINENGGHAKSPENLFESMKMLTTLGRGFSLMRVRHAGNLYHQ